MVNVGLVTFGLLLILQKSMAFNETRKFQTCEPELFGGTGGTGFKVCLFDSKDNLVTAGMGIAGNMIWSLQNSNAFALGECYCRQDCTPSQIVCTGSTIQSLLFPQIVINIQNGIAQFVYAAEMWKFYCYCPQLAGPDPCAAPPNPSVCSP